MYRVFLGHFLMNENQASTGDVTSRVEDRPLGDSFPRDPGLAGTLVFIPLAPSFLLSPLPRFLFVFPPWTWAGGRAGAAVLSV